MRPSALSRWLFLDRIPTWKIYSCRPIVKRIDFLNLKTTFPTLWSKKLTMAAGPEGAAGTGGVGAQQPEGGGGFNQSPLVTLPRTFDKTQFEYDLHIKALRIPARECQHYMKLLSR